MKLRVKLFSFLDRLKFLKIFENHGLLTSTYGMNIIYIAVSSNSFTEFFSHLYNVNTVGAIVATTWTLKRRYAVLSKLHIA